MYYSVQLYSGNRFVILSEQYIILFTNFVFYNLF
nr:MAG TPA: hypothetical protein [Bacteriophage sp.]DAY36609.1 MAG TPA: hypothetical protein [Bacteriophage sp.]